MLLTTSLLPAAVLAASALAAPNPQPWHLPTSPGDLATQALDSAQSWVHSALKQFEAAEDRVKSDIQVSKVDMRGIEYLSLTHPAFPLHRLRVVQPQICDPDVHQLSGYLDISESKHLFFWFEESRNKPKSDPLVLWLNGGPGCSSTTGLLFELGGCTIVDKGANVTHNPDAWNSAANVLFLDQPIGVGFSYADNGEEVNNSPVAAEDVYAFLMLFISKFEEYSKLDFHIAGESYAGTYIPNIASTIFKHNTALQLAPTPNLPQLNLKSVLIGNGLTNPYEQFGSVPDWACTGPYAVYDPASPQCTSLYAKAPRCQNLISGCYRTGSRFACVPASLYCWSLFNELQQLGLNMYDVRKKCDKSEDKDGPLCYKEMGWMETYLNQPDIKRQLGAPAEVNFQSCNMQINQNFLLQGDGTHNSAALLPDLVEAGIRVLIYSGQADMLVNFIGCSRVLDTLDTSYLQEYAGSSIKNFTDSDGTVAGWTRSAGKGAGNVAFVAFKNAGHMVPHDDPVAALTMFKRWIRNEPLA